MNDLREALTTDLINELSKRYDHCLFVGLKDENGLRKRKRAYKGDRFSITGLATDAAVHLSQFQHNHSDTVHESL